MREERNDNLYTVERVTFRGSETELAFPIELSDGDLNAGSYNGSRIDDGPGMALLLFRIVQRQLDVLETKIKALEPKDDKSHPFADDIMMGDPTPIKYCKICKNFLLLDSDRLALPGIGVCQLDGRMCDAGHPGCGSFDRNA